ncbi:bifunctional phosphopantothenoylcysteine decarboxylase/phosphopantothenate--cysteine ligase CoaBC [Teredinibacter turnerae]|uniref:bifunctional phosphopantothenoylcysteine decarboxylase/phosphopantothenate--cysteine ligase CoaBC n=1 Tax=Teredinibacter turnerae TaxID=2426 RepID=UPI00036F036C|nr:bifunctional phosphopantothenoylcysteine decarboxylase/phosphopantothenate--cysteine ligase CoaBC [Teredinibacter turnerae]
MSVPDSTLSLANKNIVLGVTGGIAAYKSAELVRQLQNAGAEVHVVMTAAATEFITPLTLQALSGNPVHTSMLDPAAEAGMGHIELARWADALVIAPATADFIARFAQGEGNELLLALCLATAAPVMIAPAMNQEMWRKDITQENVARLLARGVIVCGPDEGVQACGDVGPGRMLQVEALTECIAAQFQLGSLAGRHVVITAGPTREAIDPVRYLTNRSSGKMGYALAEAALDAGAQVTLVSGPVNLSPPPKVRLVAVESALEMHAATLAAAESADVVIGAAAVADYRPQVAAQDKLKKHAGEPMQLTLVENPDIIADVAALPGLRFVVGFAAETQHLEEYAQAKLKRKRLHAIIANNVADGGVFEQDENEVTVFSRDGGSVSFARRGKKQLARGLIQWIAAALAEKPCD